MDIETRGLISATINYVFEKQSVLETVEWILGADDQIISKEDLALGYFIGSLMNIADKIASRRKLEEKSTKLYKKKLEKIFGKEKTETEVKKPYRAKRGRRIEAELTEEETEDIKNMLIPMIVQFREKIRKEIALRRV